MTSSATAVISNGPASTTSGTTDDYPLPITTPHGVLVPKRITVYSSEGPPRTCVVYELEAVRYGVLPSSTVVTSEPQRNRKPAKVPFFPAGSRVVSRLVVLPRPAVPCVVPVEYDKAMRARWVR